MNPIGLNKHIETIYLDCVKAKSLLNMLRTTINQNNEGIYNSTSKIGIALPLLMHSLDSLFVVLADLYDRQQNGEKVIDTSFKLVTGVSAQLTHFIEIYIAEIENSFKNESSHETDSDEDISNCIYVIGDIFHHADSCFGEYLGDREAA